MNVFKYFRQEYIREEKHGWRHGIWKHWDIELAVAMDWSVMIIGAVIWEAIFRIKHGALR